MESASARSPGLLDRMLARTSLRRDGWFFLVVAAVIAADQFSKWIIRAGLDRGDSWPDGWHVRIVHFVNTGAAFGILQNSGPLLVVTSVVGVVALFVYLFNPGFAHPLVRVGLALMLGGAIGNLIDRLARGEVVDFLKVPRWPAFNIADSAITIGVLCLLWAVLWIETPPNDESASS
jgi:signal peptidase II